VVVWSTGSIWTAWVPYDGCMVDIRSGALQDKLEEAGRAVVFSIPGDAMKALAKLADYSKLRRETQTILSLFKSAGFPSSNQL